MKRDAVNTCVKSSLYLLKFKLCKLVIFHFLLKSIKACFNFLALCPCSIHVVVTVVKQLLRTLKLCIQNFCFSSQMLLWYEYNPSCSDIIWYDTHRHDERCHYCAADFFNNNFCLLNQQFWMGNNIRMFGRQSFKCHYGWSGGIRLCSFFWD